MRKLEIKNADLMRVAIQQEISRTEESRYNHRLHGILLICSGYSCYKVADLLGHSPRTVEYWVKRFEQKGFAGLRDRVRLGRPSVLDDTTSKAIEHDFRRCPRELGYNQNFWDGKLLSHHLTEMYGVQISVRQCQRLFHKLGFRRRKPRPVIAKADPEAQRAYKKNSMNWQQ